MGEKWVGGKYFRVLVDRGPNSLLAFLVCVENDEERAVAQRRSPPTLRFVGHPLDDRREDFPSNISPV